ncbi:hypothetical protein Acr_13g0015230 [Actinidia rufa]|uniref:Uncharacterized protein n=1 Tax=Actinidia rufa TaxID=165716 RepID=A0A7J0FNG3_9ERIC|nr:hypothetical protein Acr_13g0015230 [Actinidia rufa]
MTRSMTRSTGNSSSLLAFGISGKTRSLGVTAADDDDPAVGECLIGGVPTPKSKILRQFDPITFLRVIAGVDFEDLVDVFASLVGRERTPTLSRSRTQLPPCGLGRAWGCSERMVMRRERRRHGSILSLIDKDTRLKATPAIKKRGERERGITFRRGRGRAGEGGCRRAWVLLVDGVARKGFGIVDGLTKLSVELSGGVGSEAVVAWEGLGSLVKVRIAVG